jgi:hypothetical protein
VEPTVRREALARQALSFSSTHRGDGEQRRWAGQIVI